MIGIVAKLQIQDGKGAAFEALITELGKAVRANEPGVVAYHLAKSRTAPNSYNFMEIYTDQAAVDAHRATPYFIEAMPKLMGFLDGAPQTEYLDVVA